MLSYANANPLNHLPTGARRRIDGRLVYYVIFAQPISRFSALSLVLRRVSGKVRPRDLRPEGLRPKIRETKTRKTRSRKTRTLVILVLRATSELFKKAQKYKKINGREIRNKSREKQEMSHRRERHKKSICS